MYRPMRICDCPFPRATHCKGDLQPLNEKAQEWENYDNYHRPHGALQGQTQF